MWGVSGSSSSSLSYSLRVVDNGVVYLDSNGLCQRGLLIYLQLGKVLSASIKIFLFGRLCHIASWGVFSKKGMLEFLREMNYLSLKSNPFSFVPC